MMCVKCQADQSGVEIIVPGAGLTRVNAGDAGRVPDDGMQSQRGAANMSCEFEWTDFAMQSPCAMAELLDAAGIDGSIPCHELNGADAESA